MAFAGWIRSTRAGKGDLPVTHGISRRARAGSAIAAATAALLVGVTPVLADAEDPPGEPQYLPTCWCAPPGVPDEWSPSADRTGGSLWSRLLARLESLVASTPPSVPAGARTPDR